MADAVSVTAPTSAFAFASRKERRQKLDITQQQLAKKLGSRQSRVAKIEKADRSVSMELLMRSLVTLGASREEIGNVIIGRPTRVRKAQPAKFVTSSEIQKSHQSVTDWAGYSSSDHRGMPMPRQFAIDNMQYAICNG